ncbi:MAG: HAMP domain-containing protein [Gammaproteobacteria bacterium]|nr:HAMP domain-containing protein [Gammaproteobacteria bacterium]
MRWTIGKRLFAALTATSLIIIGLYSVATRLSFQQSFVDYLSEQEDRRLASIVEVLQATYEVDGSWQLLGQSKRRWDEALRPPAGGPRKPPPRGERGAHPPPRFGEGPPPDELDLRSRLSLLDANGDLVAGYSPKSGDIRTLPVVVDTMLVGELVILNQTRLSKEVDVHFAAQQTRSVLFIAIATLILAAVIAALITRQIVRPIRALTTGARSLSDGDFESRIDIRRDDELGDLAGDFNQLARSLERGQTLRRQWVADIAHELRTPLSILSGELQAIEDGIRVFDEATRRSLQAEVQRLSKLVTDLHVLTTSDEGGLSCQLKPVNLTAIVRETLETNRARIHDAGLGLDVQLPDREIRISGDESRLVQLLNNLIENSIRYTDADGTLSLAMTVDGSNAILTLSDSAPAVPEADLPKLFDRLFRVDASRNRETGGSGLGLSICEAIVAAHDGSISASSSPLGGLSIVVSLPHIGAS